MCGGCAPATGINSPPEGGVHGPPARFACAVPAAPRALPGRGLAPPDPQGCAPWCAFAHRAPAASVTQPEGFRARVRPVAGVVNRLRLSTLDAQLLAVFGLREKFKGGQCEALGVRGRAPVVGRRWATRPRRWAARAAVGCARRPRTGRGCPRATGLRGRAFEAVWLSLLKTRIKSAWPES